MEARIKIHPTWIANPKALMERLNGIVSYGKCDEGPWEKVSGYQYQLDCSNDWWASIEGEELVIGSRYGGERFKTLVAFCKVWLE